MFANDSVRPLTPDEYFAWEAEQEQRYEFFEGKVFAMAGGSVPHGMIALNVATALKSKLKGRGCLVLNSDCKIGLGDFGPFTYPDVSVTCSDRDRTAQKFIQDPCLIVEVLSPGTEAYDRGGKFALYRRFPSLETYVLISSDTQGVEVYQRLSQDVWQFTPYDRGSRVQLEALGIDLEFSDIYEDVMLPEPPHQRSNPDGKT